MIRWVLMRKGSADNHIPGEPSIGQGQGRHYRLRQHQLDLLEELQRIRDFGGRGGSDIDLGRAQAKAEEYGVPKA
jgi:hypothetical protein